MNDRPNVTCAGCGHSTHWLEVFPDDLCLACYEAKMENVPMAVFAQQITETFGSPTKKGKRQ